jgi:hypothetical protein
MAESAEFFEDFDHLFPEHAQIVSDITGLYGFSYWYVDIYYTECNWSYSKLLSSESLGSTVLRLHEISQKL